MQRATSAGDLGVYVHVPFCERICPYCDFAVEAQGSLSDSLAAHYVSRLLDELALARKQYGAALERPLATVYLGGGTPALLPPGEIARLLEAIAPGRRGPSEVTIELNPGWLETGRLADFRAAGVTRLSVGVQSFADDTLRRLGRGQSGAETRQGLEACLGAGFDSVSADLILAAPGQSLEGFTADLEALIDLEVPHVSVYALTIEAGTPFGRARADGKLALPDEELAAAMMRATRSRLAAAGYEQYEISSFARPGHRSRHNQRYWQRRDVLGLGVSAASLLEPVRVENLRDRAGWERALAAGRLPVAVCERLDPHERRREAFSLGLRRLDGVSRAEYARAAGGRPEDDFAAELGELGRLGLISCRGGALALTERGILFADEVFLRFVGR